MSLSLKAALAATLETSINAALQYDPATRQRLESIRDVLAIQFTFPDLCLYLQANDQSVRVSSYSEEPVATTLSGSPMALMSLLSGPASLANSGASLVGSVGLLQQWQQILNQLDIDWQAAIDKVFGEKFGDYVTPYMAKAAASGTRYVQTQTQEHQRLLKEFLEDELRLIPNRQEVEYFFEQIRSLSLDVDRLEARLQKLESKEKTES